MLKKLQTLFYYYRQLCSDSDGKNIELTKKKKKNGINNTMFSHKYLHKQTYSIKVMVDNCVGFFFFFFFSHFFFFFLLAKFFFFFRPSPGFFFFFVSFLLIFFFFFFFLQLF